MIKPRVQLILHSAGCSNHNTLITDRVEKVRYADTGLTIQVYR